MASSKTVRRKYDVFLSFRGEDVRATFLEYVYRALTRKGIFTFKDDDKLKNGEDIKGNLYEAIEESSFSIVIISVNYADSSWCLDELVHILHCKRTIGHVVYPVFYRVAPSEIRKREGDFGKGFDKAASKNEGNVEIWQEALEEVANLKGWAYPDPKFQNEATLIDDLVHTLFIEAIDTYPISAEGLVGIESRMEEVIQLLDLGSEETRVVGLWGMGVIGKTTLAEAVYNAISWQFEGCSFIDDVTEISDRSGVSALQEHLISDILVEPDFKVRSAVFGKRIIESKMRNKKVLIVLDNVNETEQWESLAGDLRWFKRGSRIIVTSRNEKVMRVCGARKEDVFEVRTLNRDDALHLFKSKAFAEGGETGEFKMQINRAIMYASGVPLALKVLGSSLLDETVDHWQSALDKLRESPGDKVQRVLKSSYDGLDWKEKEIFLDIACFFKKQDKYRMIKLLDGCGFNAVSGIDVLVKKSLLTISSNDNLRMHDLVQKMGLSVVHEESRNEPGERSRLWSFNDVKHVLMQNTGTKKVQCISVNTVNVQPRPDAFAKMTSLRFLYIIGSCCAIDLSNNLRGLYWDGYPLRCMPSTFQPMNLVELHLSNSPIEQLWDGTMVLPMLYALSLEKSSRVTKCPDLTGFPNLEELCLEGCSALVDLHPSIISLKKLRVLSLTDCSSLQTLPFGIESGCLQYVSFSGCLKLNNILERFVDLKCLTYLALDETGITGLPQSIGKATRLDYLSLMGCSSLNYLPEELGLLYSLEFLDVSFSAVRKLPTSVECLKNLQTLKCNRCKLVIPPSFSEFGSLTTLDLGYCCLKSIPESISSCLSLEDLFLHGNDFVSLPASIRNFTKLKNLILYSCKSLQELPELPSGIELVEAVDCESLKAICCPNVYRHARYLLFTACPKLLGNEEISILMGYKFLYNQIKENMCRCLAYSSPGSQIPDWITWKNVGGSITWHMPIQALNASNLLGIAFSFVVATKGQTCDIGVHIGIEGIFFCDVFNRFSSDNENLINLFYPRDYFKLDEFDFGIGATDLEVCFIAGEPGKDSYERRTRGYKQINDKPLDPAPEVKECGIRLIYEEEAGSSSSGEIKEPPHNWACLKGV